MPLSSFSDLGNDIGALSRRIEDRVRALRKAGQFEKAYEEMEFKLRERERKLRSRVDEAVRSGHTWNTVKAELERDYSSLYDNLIRFEQQIDTQFERAGRA